MLVHGDTNNMILQKVCHARKGLADLFTLAIRATFSGTSAVSSPAQLALPSP